MFNDSVLYSITAGKEELSYPYYQHVSHGHILKVGGC